MPTRICQLITTLDVGGAEQCVFELASRLDRTRFDVHVVGLRGGALVRPLREAGVRVRVLNVRGAWSVANPLKLRRLAAVLRAGRFDILHTHLFHAGLAGRLAAKRAGIRTVLNTLHVAESRFRPWQFAFARRFRRRCDRIICVSNSVMQWHAERTKLSADRYQVIANGVDVAAFGPDEGRREQARRQWGIEPNDVVVGFIGRLDPQKGVDVLLAAFEELHRGGPSRPLRLLIAGEGPLRPQVESFCQTPAGQVCQVLGFVDDVRPLLSAADLFVLPSRWEGCPLALAEAMAMSLPAVGADVPGIRDMLVPDRTGLLVRPEDPAALAGAIATLAGDESLRRALGAAALHRAEACFGIDRYIAAHEAVYEDLIGPADGAESLP